MSHGVVLAVGGAKHLTAHRTDPTTKNHLAPNVVPRVGNTALQQMLGKQRSVKFRIKALE